MLKKFFFSFDYCTQRNRDYPLSSIIMFHNEVGTLKIGQITRYLPYLLHHKYNDYLPDLHRNAYCARLRRLICHGCSLFPKNDILPQKKSLYQCKIYHLQIQDSLEKNFKVVMNPRQINQYMYKADILYLA